jgi:hypothetical protein
MAGFASALNSSRLATRPMGLWVLAACNLVACSFLAASPVWALSVLYDPVPQDIVLGDWAEHKSWVLLAILAGICLSTVGTLRGSKTARTLLITLLVAVSLASLWDAYLFWQGYRALGYALPDLNWFGIWNGTLAVRLFAWLGVNVWFVSVSRARFYFS